MYKMQNRKKSNRKRHSMLQQRRILEHRQHCILPSSLPLPKKTRKLPTCRLLPKLSNLRSNIHIPPSLRKLKIPLRTSNLSNSKPTLRKNKHSRKMRALQNPNNPLHSRKRMRPKTKRLQNNSNRFPSLRRVPNTNTKSKIIPALLPKSPRRLLNNSYEQHRLRRA